MPGEIMRFVQTDFTYAKSAWNEIAPSCHKRVFPIKILSKIYDMVGWFMSMNNDFLFNC